MRRSAAPSAKRTAQKLTTPLSDTFTEVSSTSDWREIGATSKSCCESSSSAGSISWKENRYEPISSSHYAENKIIFNVVWRDITNKKHKTWKGDGILEVLRDGTKAVLKDDTGKYMGTGSNFKISELEEGFQMTISGKEIELQEQLTDHQKILEKRKLQVANRGWGEEEWQPKEPTEKKIKGSFVFRSTLVLPDMPKMSKNSKVLKEDKQRASAGTLKIDPLVLTTGSDTDCAVQISDILVKHLRPHQREGVKFLYSCLLGLRTPGYYGAILADEMGLGKTLQCLTIMHTLLRKGPTGERVLQRVLIVTPSSIVATWNNEINKWLSTERMYAFVVDGKHKLQQYSQQKHIPFIIVSYETLLLNTDDFKPLEFDLLICDEGHRLKSSSTKIYNALRDLNIMRRIILTGTPVQNDMQEFFTLVDFVNPGVLGEYSKFRQHFELPIIKSQSPDACEEIKSLASQRASELQDITGKFLLRRTQDINQKYLPKKREYIVFVRPSELQQLMLQKVVDFYTKKKDTILQNLTPLQIITVLQKICNHPSLIARTKKPNLFTRNLERYLPDWSEMGPFDSGKLELVQNLLNITAIDGREKIVIVSSHTKTLNMLQGLCDYLNLKFLILDGGTPAAERNVIVQKFNNNPSESEDTELVFLLSAKAGGMGLNLCGATRLVLFDNDWNPAIDAQAMSRIWRDGQQNDVQIYRLVTAGTIEECIFQRQVAKLSLGNCCLAQVGTRNENVIFSMEDLSDLFTLQTDFTHCQTHERLVCKCLGDGKNQLLASTSKGKQINELMQWKHFGSPFSQEILESAHLQQSCDNIVYMFSHETNMTA